MNNETKPVLIEAGQSPYLSSQTDVEGKFSDYHARYTSSPVDEHISSVFKLEAIQTPHDALDKGYITRGQWLIWVVKQFYSQMTNGGIAQFLVNCEEHVADVAIALKFLELPEFADAYFNLVEPLIDDLDKNRRSAGGLSVFRQVRAKFRDFEAIRQKVLDHSADSGIDRHFVLRWDEERKGLYWPPELWSQQMLTRTVAYIEAHPSDFQHLGH